MKQSSQPAQPGVGLQLQPFSGGSSWSRPGAHSTVRYAARTPCHNVWAREDGLLDGLLSGKGVPETRRGPQAWGRRKPLSNPHWAILSHSLPRDLHRKVFGSCRCRTRDVAREGRKCSRHALRDIVRAPSCQGYACARMHGRETWPLLPPGFQKPGLPSTHTPPNADASIGFRKPLWARFSRSTCRPKKIRSFGKKNEKLQIASTTCSSPRVDES